MHEHVLAVFLLDKAKALGVVKHFTFPSANCIHHLPTFKAWCQAPGARHGYKKRQGPERLILAISSSLQPIVQETETRSSNCWTNIVFFKQKSSHNCSKSEKDRKSEDRESRFEVRKNRALPFTFYIFHFSFFILHFFSCQLPPAIGIGRCLLQYIAIAIAIATLLSTATTFAYLLSKKRNGRLIKRRPFHVA